MVKLPRITLVTPNYNGGKYLRYAIESVVEQDYPNLEYFVIDGGSSDRSHSIIDEYRGFIDRVVIEADRGQADAINKGIRMATGEIFHWLNSDDLLERGALTAVGEAFASKPDVECVTGSVLNFRDAQTVVNEVPNEHLDLINLYRYCCGLSSPLDWHQPGCWWRLSTVKKAGDLRLDIPAYFDREWFLRLLMLRPKVISVNRGLVRFRFHEESISNGYSSSKVLQASRFLRAYADRIPGGRRSFDLYRRRLWWFLRVRGMIPGQDGASALKVIGQGLQDPAVRMSRGSGFLKLLKRSIQRGNIF